MSRPVIRPRAAALLATLAALAATAPAAALTLLSADYEMTPTGRLIPIEATAASTDTAPRLEVTPWSAIDAPLVLDGSFDAPDGALGQLGRLGRLTTAARRPIRFNVIARDFSREPARRQSFDTRARDAALPAIQARLTIRF